MRRVRHGIDVAHKGERIVWTERDWTYSYEFDARQYRAEVERALELSRELLDAVTDERVDVNWSQRDLFPRWNETTERVMRGLETEYQRRRGLPDKPGERSGWRLYVSGCLAWPWALAPEMWRAIRSEPRETIGALPGSLWYVFKEQRKTEWRWLRERLSRDRRD